MNFLDYNKVSTSIYCTQYISISYEIRVHNTGLGKIFYLTEYEPGIVIYKDIKSHQASTSSSLIKQYCPLSKGCTRGVGSFLREKKTTPEQGLW